MKILSLKTKEIFDVDFPKSGENCMPCPACKKTRNHPDRKSFTFNATKGAGQCRNCEDKFVAYNPTKEKKEYKLPDWKNNTELTDRALAWFVGRGIGQETLKSLGVCSGTEWMPQANGNMSVICFPYYMDGVVKNVKYRSGGKDFKLFTGGELVFYNIDALKDVREAVIVEGEIDCLSFIEAGVKNVVSVPNGAGATSLDYVDNCFNELQFIEKFYIGADNDPAGYKLREELIRRFGAENCKIISYCDCKDANEYLTTHGGFELASLVTSAKEVPVAGILTQRDIYDDVYNLFINGLQPGAGILVPEIDNCITWELGRICVVSGVPSHGKSEVVDFLVSRLNIIHGWKVAEYSPENFPPQLHHSKISAKIIGKSFDSKFIPKEEFDKTFDYIDENYYFITPEEDITIETILDKAKYLVRRYGIKILVIDPYNKLDHSRKSSESETEYISRFLDKLSMFAKVHNVLVILVAHPTKMQRQKDDPNKFMIPTLYDISGSAHFYNKTDYGLIVYRDFIEGIVKLIWSKVKFKHLGAGGEVDFHYNAINGRIHPRTGTEDYGNYLDRNWDKAVSEQIPANTDFDEPPF